MTEGVIGTVSGLLLAMVAGFFGLPWLGRRNAEKTTEATVSQLNQEAAQAFYERYENLLKAQDLKVEAQGLRIDRLTLVYEAERAYSSMIVIVLRDAGLAVPPRPPTPSMA